MIIYTYKQISQLTKALENNNILILPTDTVYGLLCLNQDYLYRLKKRDNEKPIIRFVNDLNAIQNLDNLQREFLKTFWPGVVTIIKDKISYRMPNNELILTLLDKLNNKTVYCTSANLSGLKPIRNLVEANKMFSESPLFQECVFVQSPYKQNNEVPSTIINIDDWTILRFGKNASEVIWWLLNNRLYVDANIYQIIDDNDLKYMHWCY